MNAAVGDLVRGWERHNVWLMLAWDDLRLRYQRSVLGPLWITLGTGFFISVLSILWTEIMAREASVFVPWFAIGLTTWQMISAVVTEGSTTFSRISGIIQNIPMPLSTHVYRAVTRHVFNYFHNFVIVILVLVIFPPPLSIAPLLFIPGFLIIIITAIATSVILGILGARFRDLSYAVSMLMGPMFFMTPILWMPDMLGSGRAQIADINPFTHFLAIIREPLLGRAPDLLNYAATIGISVTLILIALYLLHRHRTKVPYWV